MYPSSSRILAISTFSFDAGTSTRGCFAMTALRRRVSISAIGSVISRVLCSFTVNRLRSTVFFYHLPASQLPTSQLPTRFRHARDVALQCQLPEAEATQRELAQIR